MNRFQITTHSGEAARRFANDIVRLRIAVFREFPYLYDGSLDYEMNYLERYFISANSLIVLAQFGSDIVGVSTGIPLAEADDDFRKPVEAAGIDVNEVFYFGESVLLPEFRGHGLGHKFFAERENHAVKLGFPRSGFFSVIRPNNHPLKPLGYHSHDIFWQKHGYTRDEAIISHFSWQQVGDSHETLHELVFWHRQLF